MNTQQALAVLFTLALSLVMGVGIPALSTWQHNRRITREKMAARILAVKTAYGATPCIWQRSQEFKTARVASRVLTLQSVKN